MKRVLIGIDASRSNVKQRTGTEYYSYEIVKNLIKNDEVNFRLYSKTPLEYIGKAKNIENKVMSFPKLWSQLRLSYEIMKNPPDVLFEPAHTIPIYHGKKTVVTLHDVGFKYFPGLYTPLERIYHNWCMGFSLKHATKIIAISEATKKDLIKIYHADPNKISVIYHGYDKNKFYPLTKAAVTSEKIQSLKPYIYFIGRLEAKKNLVNLVRAYGILRKNKKITHKLVFAGRPGYQYEQIKGEIEKLPDGVKQDVVELGYVPDEEMGELMRNASVFAFPSNFEGFGMPLVEAMASKVPVVASDTTSIPEILGDAGLMSDPKDYQKMAENLKKVILDEKLRDNLTARGLERAKTFSWEDAAKKTLEVIKPIGMPNS